jgi:hypothetical protein
MDTDSVYECRIVYNMCISKCSKRVDAVDV